MYHTIDAELAGVGIEQTESRPVERQWQTESVYREAEEATTFVLAWFEIGQKKGAGSQEMKQQTTETGDATYSI